MVASKGISAKWSTEVKNGELLLDVGEGLGQSAHNIIDAVRCTNAQPNLPVTAGAGANFNMNGCTWMVWFINDFKKLPVNTRGLLAA